MIEVVFLAIIFALCGLCAYLATRLLAVADEARVAHEVQLKDLLDRIQAPDLEAYKQQTADLPAFPEIPEYLYDPTGLVEVEAEDDDGRVV